MFDYQKFTKILKEKKITSQYLCNELENRGITITIDGIKQYRVGKVKNPPYHVVTTIADICNISFLDFYTDGKVQKERIIKHNSSIVKGDIIGNGNNNGHTINNHNSNDPMTNKLIEIFNSVDENTKDMMFFEILKYKIKG